MTCIVLNRVSVGNSRSKEQVLNVVNNHTVELYDTIVKWSPDQDGGITDEAVTNLMGELDGDITIRVNSQGGDVGASMGIYNAIKNYDRGETTAVVDGYAFSSAGWIPQAANNRKIATGGIFMAHNPQMRPPIGSEADIESVSNQWRAFKKSIVDIFTKATNLSDTEISDMMDATTWLSAEDAVNKGFFDEIDNQDANLAALNYGTPVNIPENLFKPKENDHFSAKTLQMQRQRNILRSQRK
jgi:ATP-dependent protease ClpP protease subunit